MLNDLAKEMTDKLNAWMKANPAKRDWLFAYMEQNNIESLGIALLFLQHSNNPKFNDYLDIFTIMRDCPTLKLIAKAILRKMEDHS